VNKKNLMTWLLASLAFMAGLSSFAAEKESIAAGKFERLAVEVNGIRKLLDAEQSVQVVQGDLVTVLDGWVFEGKSEKVDAIDIVGFSSKINDTKKDDRGFVVDTARDLQKKHAIGPDKNRYELRGLHKNKVVARIELIVEKPRLDSFDITVNGVARKIQNGETLSLKKSDNIVVTSIATNVLGNENITHVLREVTPKKSDAKELVFFRSRIEFARVPIRWQE
jgi:hypothetical protein